MLSDLRHAWKLPHDVALPPYCKIVLVHKSQQLAGTATKIAKAADLEAQRRQQS